MESQKFGDSKKWKKLKKKLTKNQELDSDEFQYYKMQGAEYTESLAEIREWQIGQMEKLQESAVGDNERWEKLKQKLRKGENLQGVDLEYYHAKFREYEQGVVTTTHDVEGKEIVAYLGIVSGQAVIGLMFLKDAILGLTDVFGGRSGIMERNFKTAKDIALKQMTDEAKTMGANAVVGVDIDFNSIEGKNKQMLMVIASGTAVITRSKQLV